MLPVVAQNYINKENIGHFRRTSSSNSKKKLKNQKGAPKTFPGGLLEAYPQHTESVRIKCFPPAEVFCLNIRHLFEKLKKNIFFLVFSLNRYYVTSL